MIIVYNNLIPPKGFKALTLWPFIFIRRKSNSRFTERKERHERIHGEQQKEMLIVFMLLWYAVEWIVRLVQYRDRLEAYYNISFEREAYANQYDPDYLSKRKRYAWTHYLKEKQ